MTGLITRFNPVVLVAIALTAALGSPAIRTMPVALVCVAVYVVTLTLLVPSWRYPALCLALVALPIASIMWSTWLLGGRDLEVAVVAGLRTFVMTWPGAVAVGYVDVARLGDYLAQTLRVPGRFAAALSAALQRVTGVWQTWHELERVRRSRGLPRRPGAMAFTLLVHTMREATGTSIAMDARGFASAGRRTWAEPAVWTRLDVAVLAAAVALGALPVALRLIGT
ncbi:energy-coupling factor transporter transmembrane component T family protein [Aeromicrobium duanguangcaii]|uniref:Energy-coupling factor transporter transmembrane protein EcfT n=1 Tax=Aeromicrobium duanguangcaii TaxID=2968086 RepID=A0ABY5KGZ6_9ACTN|nr:energy-coupling factor transporter transmembrane component T [Aeromicrobium duanguangcaii]MCD9155412.1 energy-coupling factor transporter transmembrane protein EcfT [Aeromicrobium duanguangcaii]UUI68316.1 energy-coupling factor transporter transmembrane protein EcfT [Aeromicrobium duanguangcaii]